ncbi:hypothetical protein M0R88_10320 [Halorussus gelatinilyticus]|uniref:Uncharacterized protein n=1 Tax=Halorussus gelatinilyticus TaxID=2937524 RepID=A0A8U0IDY2_9EURY|nr:hypothetical protein [Halorussus gelatinilyticus]UPV98925.1 hypothetical protein M0R88_10320 [Halorussus gelatinilyticus]
MTQTDPRRRILDKFGADDEIAGIDTDYTLADLKLFIPTVALALICLLSGVASGGILPILGGAFGAVIILAVTLTLVVVTPPHRTPQNWFTQILQFKRQPKLRTLTNRNPEERTETLMQISKFDADAGGVRREDGTLVGGVVVEPANMALATDEEWHIAADALGRALNSLGFDIQIRSTARQVDTADLVAGYDQRLDDADVRANDQLRSIIEVYRRRLPSEFRRRGTSVREYQILVPVSVHEVQLAERGALARLKTVPYIGGLLAVLGAESTRLSESELERAQHDLLTERRQAVEDAIRGLDSCTAEPVSAATLADWVEESWTGRRTQYDPEPDHDRLRTRLVTSGSQASENHRTR